jgi:6-pyruvoyltetrahydropterin/6-carboxytetrahydropterin synthase
MNNSNRYLISRQIGIDAGHRIPKHSSKCRNLHGHRYTIEAWCEGGLIADGSEEGIVIDFSFLKEEMMHEIDGPCDHGFIFYLDDELCWEMFRSDDKAFEATVREHVASKGFYYGLARGDTQICVLAFVPTAENLARFWFERLYPKVDARTGGRAVLSAIKVWETPNCWAVYEPGTRRTS